MGSNQNTIAAINHQQAHMVQISLVAETTFRCREVNLAAEDALQWPLPL